MGLASGEEVRCDEAAGSPMKRFMSSPRSLAGSRRVAGENNESRIIDESFLNMVRT